MYTLPTDQQFNLEFQVKSEFNLEFQAKFGIQLGIPISLGINLGECTTQVCYMVNYLNDTPCKREKTVPLRGHVENGVFILFIYFFLFLFFFFSFFLVNDLYGAVLQTRHSAFYITHSVGAFFSE